MSLVIVRMSSLAPPGIPIFCSALASNVGTAELTAACVPASDSPKRVLIWRSTGPPKLDVTNSIRSALTARPSTQVTHDAARVGGRREIGPRTKRWALRHIDRDMRSR